MVEIDVYDVIDRGFSGQMKKTLSEAAGEPVHVAINSPGGFVHEAVAAYGMMQNYKGQLTASVDGAAFSAASIIALGAKDGVEMAENALMMIHDPWLPSVSGRTTDLLAALDYIKKNKKAAVNIYNAKTNLGTEHISEMMREETYLLADEAKEMGFIDYVGSPAAEVQMCVEYEAHDKERLGWYMKQVRNLATAQAEVFSSSLFKRIASDG